MLCCRAQVDRINPDGTVSLLRPDNPEEVFARKIAYLRAQEEKNTSADKNGGDAAQPGGFVWKEAVDSVRAAAHHAGQLSLFLDLKSRDVLKLEELKRLNSPRQPVVDLSIQGRVNHLERARAALASAGARLRDEVSVDARFIERLAVLRENWNIKALPRITPTGATAPGPPGALSVSLALTSAGSKLAHDCDAIILRGPDGSLDVKMGPDFKLRRMLMAVRPRNIPGEEPEVGADAFEALKCCSSDSGAEGMNRYLAHGLRSILAEEIFRTMTQMRQGVGVGHAMKAGHSRGSDHSLETLSFGPVVAALASRAIHPLEAPADHRQAEKGDEMDVESAGESKISWTWEETREGAVLEVAARQLVRVKHRQSLKPKQSEGGSVPRKPQVTPTLSSLPLAGALEAIARHRAVHASVAASLESCATGRITSRALRAVLHHGRSDRADASRLTMRLTSPLRPAAGVGCDMVLVHVAVTGTEVSVSVTPAILAHRACTSDHVAASPVSVVRTVVQTVMGRMLMQAMQAEARALGANASLTSHLAEPGTGETHTLRIWHGAAQDEDGEYKVLTLVPTLHGETLTVTLPMPCMLYLQICMSWPMHACMQGSGSHSAQAWV
jgi:hypothetical protein